MRGGTQLLLDAGALIEIEARPRGKLVGQCRLAVEERRPALVPAVVFAQVWRGSPRQHALSELRRMCRIVEFTARTADDVGRLLACSHTTDVVDAAVVVAAIAHNCAVLTSDPVDLARLADAAGFPVPLLTV